MSKKTVSDVRFISFPSTEPPPEHALKLVEVFRKYEPKISTRAQVKGLESDAVLAIMRQDLVQLGFSVEGGKTKAEKIERPVFYGLNGEPELNYEIDAFHAEWRCGLEVEAGRAFKGNAVYRDLMQAMVMVQVEHLCLAVPNLYKYKLKKGNKAVFSPDFDKAVAVAEALYGHTRIKVPYRLTLIGY